MHKQCGKCGERFFDDQGWKKICLGCWKAEKNGEESKAEKIAELNKRISAQSMTIMSLQRELDNERSKKVAALDEVTVARLIRLCHPDKHNNSDAANEVTKMLLAMRK